MGMDSSVKRVKRQIIERGANDAPLSIYALLNHRAGLGVNSPC